jgi:hypothetical protein
MRLWTRGALAAIFTVSMMASACGSGRSTGGQDASVPVQSDANAVDTASSDGTPPGDAAPGDAAPGDTAPGPWPPSPPFHSGRVCVLPTCDPAGAETFDLSGTWAETMVTQSTTCNALVGLQDPRMKVGHSETTQETYVRAGECIYKDAIGGTIVGVIKDNVMAYCEVQPVDQGVTPIIEIFQTFTGDSSTGQGWIYLFDIPIITPADCQADYEVSSQRQ